MKKIILLSALLLIPLWSALAQIHNKGVLSVGDTAELYTNGIYNFGSDAATTETTRTQNKGIVILSTNAVQASDASATNFVDGYVKILPTITDMIYKSPVGFGDFSGDVDFSVLNQRSITNAYYRVNPTTIESSLAPEVENISSTEYWKVISDNKGKITLYWNEFSDIASILAGKSVDYLTILGYDGSQWVTINSITSIESTSASPNLGFMTNAETISFSDFTHYTIGSRADLACYSPVTYSGDNNIKTWTGTSWTPSAPVINDGVIIAGPLSITTDLECYSVQINADITMTDGKKMTVVNGFTGSGKIIMSNLASVIQQNPLATAPKIEMTRITENMRRYDYVFLSNPINEVEPFFNQLLSAGSVAVNGQYGYYQNSAYEQLRTFNDLGTVAINATVENTPIGRGFSATVRKQAPYSTSNAPGAWLEEKHNISVKINGTANNGQYNMTLPAENGYMRLGNPYPSPINARNFWELTDGLVDKTMYYWTYNTARGTLAADTYNNADFATYNLSGGVAATTGGPIPDGFILPMQSVLIRSIAPSSEIIIDNCVRSSFSLANPANANAMNGKFKVNLQGSTNSFSQILIAYDDSNGTIGYDNGYDAARLTGQSSELSSLIGNKRYTIQTRAAFTADDVVPLLLDKRTDETFIISLDSQEGVFEETNILLHDKALDVIHNLSQAEYSFIHTADLGMQRFDIVFENQILNTNEFNTKNAFAFISQNQFHAQSNQTIAEIAVYDLTGRLIVSFTNVNDEKFSGNFYTSQGVFIAKIKLADGTIINQKVSN